MTDIDAASVQAGIAALIGGTMDPEALENREAASGTFFSGLLSNFVHLEFSEEQAVFHWKKILENSEKLRKNIGRPVGIHTAAVDYFTNLMHLMNSPLLIEQHVFQQTEQLAMIDGLTGVFNRRYMDNVLKKELNRCERYSKEFSICLIDIDNFKKLNDTFGHQAGDTILGETAACISDPIREEDVVCRYGGEEFLVVLPETNIFGARVLANRIQQYVAESVLLSQHKVTFSAGLASYPNNGRTVETLVSAADQALYQAKFNGKNRVEEAVQQNINSVI